LVGHKEARLHFELVDVGDREVDGEFAAAGAADLDAIDGVAVICGLDSADNDKTSGMSDLAFEGGTTLCGCGASG